MDISYLITEARDITGERKVTVRDLYEELIQKGVGGKFKGESLKSANKVICPFHEDVKPSMGVLDTRTGGVEIFNCFGCGKKGNAVHFYLFFVAKYEGRQITLEQAAKELAEKFDIELQDDYQMDIYERAELERKRVMEREDSYTLRDFESDALTLREVLQTDPVKFAQYYEELREFWLTQQERRKEIHDRVV